MFCVFSARLSIIRAFVIGFLMTFFEVFDVPVFWPILLFYWVMLFLLTMRKQIQHMIKYKYVPFSFGKQVCVNRLSRLNKLSNSFLTSSLVSSSSSNMERNRLQQRAVNDQSKEVAVQVSNLRSVFSFLLIG